MATPIDCPGLDPILPDHLDDARPPAPAAAEQVPAGQAAASAPAPRRKWIADQDALTACEMDKVIAMIGCTTQTIDKHPMSLGAASAVVLAQREDPGIPDDTWRTLRMADIDFTTLDGQDEAVRDFS